MIVNLSILKPFCRVGSRKVHLTVCLIGMVWLLPIGQGIVGTQPINKVQPLQRM